MPTETVLICVCLWGSATSKWEEAQRWQNISRRKEGWRRRSQVICLAGKAESGYNVHLFWQTETTGPTHSGAGPSAEIRVKCEVEESSRVCARSVCLCVRALPQVSKAWIKSFSSLHHTSVFSREEISIDWSKLCASVNSVLSGGGKWKEIDGLQRYNLAWSDSWNWFIFLSISSISHSLKLEEKWVWKRARSDGLYNPPPTIWRNNDARLWQPCVHQKKKNGSQLHNKARLQAHSFLTPLPLTKDLRWTDKTTKVCEGPRLHDGIAFNQDFYLYTECIKMSMSGDNHVISIPLFL